jgi:hypothetical protein
MIYTLAGMASGPSLRRRSAGQATRSGRSSPRQAVQQPIRVGSGKAPGKRDRGLLVAALESEQAVLDLAKTGEVVGVRTFRWQIDR